MTECDVAVIGAGPAGASCAAKLAELGFAVSLFDKGNGRRQHRGESLPSSVRVLFERLSLSLPPEVIVERPPQHRVYWGDLRGASAESQEQSFLVWRGPFDEHLRAHACRQGVRLVSSAVRNARRVSNGFELSLDERANAPTLTCRILVDASGRAGVLARDYRRRERGFRTHALTAHFRTDEADPPTIVESFPDGWAWSAPLRDGVRDVTLMLDTNSDYHEMLARAEHVRRLVDGADMVGEVRGIDATPYTASCFCEAGLILAGDAASFLDPLSAHGVHKAMDSGLVAAVVARTILEHPAREADAYAFYHQREKDIYEVTTERLRRLYYQETRFRDQPFWKKRSLDELRAAEERPRAPSRPPGPLTPETKLSPGPGVELVDAPVLNGDFIERQQVLRAPGTERAVRFLGELALPEIYVEAIRAENAARAAHAVSPPYDEAYRAIDWLYRTGYLVE